MKEIDKLFDRALSLQLGEEIILSFSTKAERNSIRTMLYRERSKFAKILPQKAESVRIKSSDEEDYFLLIISHQTKYEWWETAKIKTPAGEIVPANLEDNFDIPGLEDPGEEEKTSGLPDLMEATRILKERENGNS